MNTSGNRKKTKEAKTGLIILAIIAALVILAIIFAAVQTGQAAAATQLVAIPAVETTLVSDSGQAHRFGARVTLELNGDPGVDAAELHAEILEAIGTLSYEDIISFQGPDIIRGAVASGVNRHLAEGELVAVFLTEVITDIPMQNRDLDRQPQRNLMFDAIFGDR